MQTTNRAIPSVTITPGKEQTIQVPRGLARAVETAREHLPIIRDIVRAEHLTPMVLGRRADGTFGTWKAAAWEEPQETPMLPWSAPEVQPLGIVFTDGHVHLYQAHRNELLVA